jgi:hypothetical protein
MKVPKDKFILDPTCSSRGIWFNKKHPNTIYTDIRREEKGFIQARPNFEINPDIIADFKDLPFPNKHFKLISWDPPHLRNLDKGSWIYKKYGSLGNNWKTDLSKGFNELWRVLDDFGVLILKWSKSHDNRPNRDISISEILKLLPVDPLFGHPSGSKSNTMWFCFMKIPGQEKQDILK